MGDLLRRAYVIARQRSDVGRRMPAMEVGCHLLALLAFSCPSDYRRPCCFHGLCMVKTSVSLV